MCPSASERLIAAVDGAVAAPAFGPDGSTMVFSVIAGGRSRLMVNAPTGGDRNIADPDEDVFPFRPQWVSPSEVLYTADGKIKRRSVAGGPARVVELTADISFARSGFNAEAARRSISGAAARARHHAPGGRPRWHARGVRRARRPVADARRWIRRSG